MYKLLLKGKVSCGLCEEEYDWDEQDEDTDVYICNAGNYVNGVLESIDGEVITKCPLCGYKNKRQRTFKVIK